VKHVPRKRRFRRQRAGAHARSAREAAFAVLSEYKNAGRFVSTLLEPFFNSDALASPDERRLAVELTNGVVRREATLDAILHPHVERPRHRIEGELWTLLQLGAYQLVFLDSIPAYAAVNETVALARSLGRERWAGFLNGVLRNVERMRLCPKTGTDPLPEGQTRFPATTGQGSVPFFGQSQRTLTQEFQTVPDSAAVPVSEGRYRRLGRTVFSDPSIDPAAYFAEAFSFPRWLASRWQARFGFEELCRIGFWFNQPSPLTLRVNPLRARREDLIRALAESGIAATPGTLPESIRLEGTARVDTLPGFAEGFFTVQDESAMQAVERLAPQPGETILDLCAAPGTKTTHIAERMRNQGRIVATDIREDRLDRVAQNCARLGISIVQPILINDSAPARRLCPKTGTDPLPEGQTRFPATTGQGSVPFFGQSPARTAKSSAADPTAGPFDAILADVPCSNTGVLGKRPEARWRMNEPEIAELAARQLQLLESACGRLRPGGRIVYSTCSIEPEENEQIVRTLLSRATDLALVGQWQLVPGRPGDGGYQALLIRQGPAATG